MKGIEFAFLAIGAVAGAFVRYKIAEFPLPVNILVVNVVGRFILGVFSILSVAWHLDARYTLGGRRVLRLAHYDVVVCL